MLVVREDITVAVVAVVPVVVDQMVQVIVVAPAAMVLRVI
jgi:hypothetical protein